MATHRIRPVTKKSLTGPIVAPIDKRPPGLAELGEQVDKRLREWARSDSLARAELGGLLDRIRAKLDRGEWIDWVTEHLPLSPRSAQQFIELHLWAKRHAVRMPELAPLGPSKLYVLMRVHDAFLTGLLARPDHVVPSTGQRKTLARMTHAELVEVVQAHDGIPAPDAATVLVDAYRTRVRSVVRAMEALVEHKDNIAIEEVEELHDELLAAAVTLSDAFRLGN